MGLRGYQDVREKRGRGKLNDHRNHHHNCSIDIFFIFLALFMVRIFGFKVLPSGKACVQILKNTHTVPLIHTKIGSSLKRLNQILAWSVIIIALGYAELIIFSLHDLSAVKWSYHQTLFVL